MVLRFLISLLPLLLLSSSNAATALMSSPPSPPIILQVPQENEEKAGDTDLDLEETVLGAALTAAKDDPAKQMVLLQAIADLDHQRQKYDQEKDVLLIWLTLADKTDTPEIYKATQRLRLSYIYFTLEQYDQSESEAQRSVELYNACCGPKSPNLALALNNLGWIEMKLKKLEKAEKHMQTALDILQHAVGKKSLLCGLVVENLGALYLSTEKYEKSLACYRRAFQILKENLSEDDPAKAELAQKLHDAEKASKEKRNKFTTGSKRKKQIAGEEEHKKMILRR